MSLKSSPNLGKKNGFRLIDLEQLGAYSPVISKHHEYKPAQRVNFVILSHDEISAKHIALALEKKRKIHQNIFWYNGSKYQEHKDNKFNKLDDFTSDNLVYFHDVLHDHDLELFNKFRDSKLVPISPFILDPTDEKCKLLSLSGKAPFMKIVLDDGSPHYVPFLYLELNNFEFDWTLINEHSITFGELSLNGGSASPTKPGFAKPTSPVKLPPPPPLQMPRKPKSGSESPETPIKLVKEKKISPDTVNEILNAAKATQEARATKDFNKWYIEFLPLFIALVIILVSSYYGGVLKSFVHFLQSGNEPTTPPVLSTVTEIIGLDDKNEVIEHVSAKSIVESVADFFHRLTLSLYNLLFATNEPHNKIISDQKSTEALRRRVAKSYLQGSVKVNNF